jgi:hypothetical protein
MMIIIIGAPKPSRRFVDDEVDAVKQADDTEVNEMDDDAEGKSFLRIVSKSILI